MISRLTHQKGMDLLSESIDAILERDVQILFLGTGDERYERMLKDWAERWPDKVSVYIEYSSDLAHQFLAASDMYIMPSIFEPCGQSQIYGMRYGSIPIVHRVGGLADTVVDYPRKGSTGFCFDAFESASLLDALDRACACYHKPNAWKKLMVRRWSKITPFIKWPQIMLNFIKKWWPVNSWFKKHPYHIKQGN